MSVWSIQIISGLDSQSKFQMFTLFSGRHVYQHTPTWQTWRLHTGLKFVQNISTNIWRSGKRTDLKLGVEKCLNNLPPITLYFLELIHWMVFDFFLIAWRCNPRIDCSYPLSQKICQHIGFRWLAEPSNYVPVKSKLQHPPSPRAFEFLENVCSNFPLPGLKSCSNAPTRTCLRGRGGGLFHW